MEIIRPGTNFDFVGNMRRAVVLSGLAVLGSIAILVANGGPNYGVDFTGGTLVQIRVREGIPLRDLRAALEAKGLREATIQDFSGGGSENEFLVRLPASDDGAASQGARVAEALRERFGPEGIEVLREEMVGPRVGSVLRRQAILSVLFATVMMGAYIWLRFDLRFGVGAATALAHDVIIAIGLLTLFRYEFDLTIVAALLTIIGFSVNDTVIVSDRIRENLRKHRRESLATVVNRSINETLSRTILTTGTAVLVLLSLFLLGGNVINGFAFALLTGFLVGTYSSIFIAAPIVLFFPERR